LRWLHLSGPVITVTVGDVIAAQGLRHPDVSTSQKVFRVATVIVTKDRPLNDDELALFDYFAARGGSGCASPILLWLRKRDNQTFLSWDRGQGPSNYITGIQSRAVGF
jgi:hypothetical protein